MMIKNLLLFVSCVLISLSSYGQKITGKTKLKSDLDSLSYMLGVDVGNSLKDASLEAINYKTFINGLTDAFEKKDLKIDEKEVKPYIKKFFQELQAEQTEIENAKINLNLKEGKAFLEKNKKKEGVITTKSGLQYEIITEGTGKSPGEADIVICHYHGTLIDGTVFDSSIDKKEKFETPLNKAIPGWSEGIQLMKEGAKYKFYIPTELAFGTKVRKGVILEQNMVLIFEVELFKVKTTEQKEN